MTGEDPPHQIDHIDRDPYNNRWENLRLATQLENSANRAGYGKYLKGVGKNGKGFKASIRIDGKDYHLGTYKTEQEAHDRYCEISELIHGQFACFDSQKVKNALDLEQVQK